MNPRVPTQQEKDELFEYRFTPDFAEPTDSDIAAELKDHIDRAAIAVFDDYITDSPGYAGRIMSVVWVTGPEYYEVYIWRNGQLEFWQPEPLFR